MILTNPLAERFWRFLHNGVAAQLPGVARSVAAAGYVS